MYQSSLRRMGIARADLLIAVAVLIPTIGLAVIGCGKAKKMVQDVRSINNLKQMCLGVYEVGSEADTPIPPVFGRYPEGANGVNASFFFHLLPYIEQENVYKKYQTNPIKGPQADNVTIKTYCAYPDPSNPAIDSNLCSYAANAVVFTNQPGGYMKLSMLENGKGASNTVILMERFARTNARTGIHNWAAYGENTNNLYLADLPGRSNFPDPIFGSTPSDITTADEDNTAHSFSPSHLLLVGLADCSVRGVSSTITARTVNLGDPDNCVSLWSWLCAARGPIGKLPKPADLPW